MKNFEIYLKNENLILLMGEDPDKFSLAKIRWLMYQEELEKQKIEICRKVKEYLAELIDRAEVLKEETIIKDNKMRLSGCSFQERKKNVDRIFTITEVQKDYRRMIGQAMLPIKAWAEPEDCRIILKKGIDYYIKLYYKRLFPFILAPKKNEPYEKRNI